LRLVWLQFHFKPSDRGLPREKKKGKGKSSPYYSPTLEWQKGWSLVQRHRSLVAFIAPWTREGGKRDARITASLLERRARKTICEIISLAILRRARRKKRKKRRKGFRNRGRTKHSGKAEKAAGVPISRNRPAEEEKKEEGGGGQALTRLPPGRRLPRWVISERGRASEERNTSEERALNGEERDPARGRAQCRIYASACKRKREKEKASSITRLARGKLGNFVTDTIGWAPD